MEDLIGNVLINSKKQELEVDEAITDKTMIGIYFSANWAPPCRLFDKRLIKFYNQELNVGKDYYF